MIRQQSCRSDRNGGYAMWGEILDKCPIAENHFTSCLLHNDLITVDLTVV